MAKNWVNNTVLALLMAANMNFATPSVSYAQPANPQKQSQNLEQTMQEYNRRFETENIQDQEVDQADITEVILDNYITLNTLTKISRHQLHTQLAGKRYIFIGSAHDSKDANQLIRDIARQRKGTPVVIAMEELYQDMGEQVTTCAHHKKSQFGVNDFGLISVSYGHSKSYTSMFWNFFNPLLQYASNSMTTSLVGLSECRTQTETSNFYERDNIEANILCQEIAKRPSNTTYIIKNGTRHLMCGAIDQFKKKVGKDISGETALILVNDYDWPLGRIADPETRDSVITEIDQVAQQRQLNANSVNIYLRGSQAYSRKH